MRDDVEAHGEASKKKPLARAAFRGVPELFDFDPHALAPVSVTAARLAPTIVLTFLPAPVVWHDAESQRRLVPAFLSHAPTIAFVVADHRSRRRSCREAKYCGASEERDGNMVLHGSSPR